MELHGIEREVTWTRLSQTAASGSNSIKVQQAVDWVVGEEIVIAPTSYNSWEVELMKITGVSSDNLTLTLNSTLKNNHLGKYRYHTIRQVFSFNTQLLLGTRTDR